jgi:hypothetical protein
MRVMVMAVMEMRRHPLFRVRKRPLPVNTINIPIASIFLILAIEILHAA